MEFHKIFTDESVDFFGLGVRQVVKMQRVAAESKDTLHARPQDTLVEDHVGYVGVRIVSVVLLQPKIAWMTENNPLIG